MRTVGGIAMFAFTITWGTSLRAQTLTAQSLTAECVDSHAVSQEARADGHWLDAKRQLLQCARQGCPALIQGDCARWFDEVEQLMPSVVLVVRRGGADVSGARIEVDGVQVLAGRDLELDPGNHLVVVDANGERVSQGLQVSPGEKHRLVQVELPLLNAPTQPPPAQAEPTHRPVQLVTWIFAGGAAAAALTGGVFGVLALVERDKLSASGADGGCAPNCTASELGNLNTLSTVSDVAFGAALVGAVGAGVTYLLRPEVPLHEATTAFRWSAGSEGAFFSYRGQF